MKIIKNIIAKIKCKLDSKKEWHKHYCTNDCKTCNYNK